MSSIVLLNLFVLDGMIAFETGLRTLLPGRCGCILLVDGQERVAGPFSDACCTILDYVSRSGLSICIMTHDQLSLS